MCTTQARIAAIFLNTEGCIEAKSGKVECGSAAYKFDQCLNMACGQCSNQTSANECVAAVEQTACKDAFDAIATACGSFKAYQDYGAECTDTTKYPLTGAGGAIQELCVGPVNDGGTDAGSDAN